MIVERRIINNLKEIAIRQISEIEKLDKKEIVRQLNLLNLENKELKEKIESYPQYLIIVKPFLKEIEEGLNNINEFSESNIQFQQIEKRGWVLKRTPWDLISSDNNISRYFNNLDDLTKKFKNYFEKEESLTKKLKHHFFNKDEILYSEHRYHFFGIKGKHAYYKDKVSYNFNVLCNNLYFSTLIKNFKASDSFYSNNEMIKSGFEFYAKKFDQNKFELDKEFYFTWNSRSGNLSQDLYNTDKVNDFFKKFKSSLLSIPERLPYHVSLDYFNKPYLDRIERNNYLIRKIELLLRSKVKQKEKLENVGYVYVLSNEAYPGVYKIGSTYGLVEERAEELTGTGHLHPFIPEFSIKIESAEYYEKTTHSLLKDHRVKQQREFFKLDLQTIKSILKEIHEVTEKGKKKLKLAELKKKLNYK